MIIEGTNLQVFALLQLKYKMKLMLDGPPGMRWRENPFVQARQLMEANGNWIGHRPNHRRTYQKYIEWLASMGIQELSIKGYSVE